MSLTAYSLSATCVKRFLFLFAWYYIFRYGYLLFNSRNFAFIFDTTSVVAMLDVSDEVRLVVQWVIYAVVCQLIDIFGTITNIINIICFVKQGFKDPVNISLLGLAVSDLGCLVPLIWTNICSMPAFSTLDLPFEPMEVQYLTGAWPHLCFNRVTSWVTVFISVERCLCITMPLKVKTLITYKRVIIIIICIFVTLISSVAPVYYANRLEFKFSFQRNKTIYGLVFTPNWKNIEAINFAINNVMIQFTAFIALIVCTLIIVVKLKRNKEWRLKSVTSGQADLSVRDQKVTKMVLVISSFFIVCFVPISLTTLSIIIEPEFSMYGKYRNLFIIIGSLGLAMESLNSAVNIFIYYSMSSRYKAALRTIFFKQN